MRNAHGTPLAGNPGIHCTPPSQVILLCMRGDYLLAQPGGGARCEEIVWLCASAELTVRVKNPLPPPLPAPR